MCSARRRDTRRVVVQQGFRDRRSRFLRHIEADIDIEVSAAPLTDIPMGRSEGGRYSAILSALLASDHTDAVVSVIGSSAQNPQIIVDRVLQAGPRNAKPLGVFLAPRADSALVQLQASGVASFRTPESCADAVNAYLVWKAPGARPQPGAEVAAASVIAKPERAVDRHGCFLIDAGSASSADRNGFRFGAPRARPE